MFADDDALKCRHRAADADDAHVRSKHFLTNQNI